MSDARICFVFASRERPEKFFAALDNIQDMSQSNNYFVWAKLDDDDPGREKYTDIHKNYPEVTVKWGVSKSKCDAINRSLEDLPECDIIVMMSDDVRWEVFGFDNEIRKAFKDHFPDYDGTVHFKDSHAVERTITLSILGINLYKKLGYLYHPSYLSVYADNDFTEMTRLMGKYVLMPNRIHDHYHPIWGMAEWDSQYRRTEDQEYYQKDRETFLKRKSERFGL